MKKITNYELREKIHGLNLKYVHVYEIQNFMKNDEPLELGINWSACGTCSINETMEFMEEMNKALEFVKEINAKKYVLVFGK